MKLENILPENLKIKFKGTEEEKEINKLGEITKKIIGILFFIGDKKGWEYFCKFRNEFKDKLKNYNGKFSDYFKKNLKEIELEEKWALRYRLHSPQNF